MKENFNDECLSFGYCQAGQENSFGWQKMKDGLIYQFALFDKLQKEGKIDFAIENIIIRKVEHLPKFVKLEDNKIVLNYLQKDYGIVLENGKFENAQNLSSTNKKLSATIKNYK